MSARLAILRNWTFFSDDGDNEIESGSDNDDNEDQVYGRGSERERVREREREIYWESVCVSVYVRVLELTSCPRKRKNR